jgi:Cellulase (glycosyl hydrolase family 5)
MSLMSQTRRRRTARVVTAAVVALAALPAASAQASKTQQSIIQDEHQMLELGPAVQARALDDAANLGADIIRVNVAWSRYAPSPKSKKRPKKFNGSNPAAYAQRKFAMLDSLIAGAQQRGMQVMLTPTGTIPAWASRCGGSVKARSTCKPSPTEFGRFVRALGKRYPQVKLWSIWNEPNLKAWLSPQYSAGGTLQSAALYRSLARSAVAGLRSTGHAKGNTILLGETAPIGSDPSLCRRGSAKSRHRCFSHFLKTRPEDFLRGVFCLSSSGHRLTGAAARAQKCSGYKRLRVNGFAHHPYTNGGGQPPLTRPNAHDITIAVTSRLSRLLDQAGRAGRVPSHLPIWFTEDGFQTNPPDRLFGVTFAQQAAYMNQSDWIAYKNSRVKTVAQYKLIDDAAQSSFQTGVRTTGGAAKPSYDAYRLPIWVSGKGSRATVYGQVRPAPDSTSQQVEVQHAAKAGAAFQTVQTVAVGTRKGQFTVKVANQGGLWRLRWNGIVSREAEVAPR